MRDDKSFSLAGWFGGTLLGLVVVNSLLLVVVAVADLAAGCPPQFTIPAFALSGCLFLIGLVVRSRGNAAGTVAAPPRTIRASPITSRLNASKAAAPAIHSIVIFRRAPKANAT